MIEYRLLYVSLSDQEKIIISFHCAIFHTILCYFKLFYGTLCYFMAARSNLGGFWLVWARFFIELDSILAVFLNKSSVAFANNRLMKNMH